MHLDEINSLRKRLADLYLIRDESKGKEIARLKETLKISYQYLENDYKKLIYENEQYMKDHPIEQPRNTEKLEQFLIQFQKLLFNYISSFISFAYHTSAFIEEMKDPNLKKKFEKIKEKNKLIEKIELFEDLRKYMHYYKLPFPRVETDYLPTPYGIVTDTIPGFCKGELSLRKEDLLKWNGFHPSSKVLISGYLGSIIIIVSYAKFGLVDEHQKIAKEMYNWLNNKVNKTFQNEIEEFQKLQIRIEKISISLQLK